MTERLELARVLQTNETSAMRSLTISRSARRHGVRARTVGGAFCVASRSFPIALLHRAVGLGTVVDATPRLLDRVVRFYGRAGLAARVEVAERVGPGSLVRLLERAGFAREEERHVVHVLETDVPPAAPTVAGLRIARASPARFGRAVRDGFEAEGAIGEFFERASAAAARVFLERALPLVPLLDGEVAGSALLWLSPRVAGLYSGSVTTPFRGRGIQLALIGERVRLGLLRRRRIFTSQTEGDGPSAHNLRDAGFRPLYEAAYFIRDTS
ncbi:hypothetical protein BH18CHL2_BH18CHL2_08480 [soil metagenome]